MSTPKFEARKVFKNEFNKVYKVYRNVFQYFETRDGRKFKWVRQSEAIDLEHLFILKYLPIHKINEYRYEIYEVNKNQMYYPNCKTKILKHINSGFYLQEIN